jgi:hypothetical protein
MEASMAHALNAAGVALVTLDATDRQVIQDASDRDIIRGTVLVRFPQDAGDDDIVYVERGVSDDVARGATVYELTKNSPLPLVILDGRNAAVSGSSAHEVTIEWVGA